MDKCHIDKVNKEQYDDDIKGILKHDSECKQILAEVEIGVTGEDLPTRCREARDLIIAQQQSLEQLAQYANLRDKFAMAALTGLLASCGVESGFYDTPSRAAEVAYEHADAMMEARKKNNESLLVNH